MFRKNIIVTFFLLLIILTGCHQTTEQTSTQGNLQGTVSCLLSGGTSPVYRAFILCGDRLLATSDSQGSYHINNLYVGNYELLASALFCGDTTLSVRIQGGRTVTLDFTLKPDSATGTVLGEFQDGWLWEQRLQEDSSLTNWSEQKICDTATGATLQYKTLKDSFPDFIPYCYLFLSDSSLILADNWAQYGIILPCGTYPLTGKCDTYKSVTRIVQVLPDSIIYKNFILPREEIAKPIAKLNRD